MARTVDRAPVLALRPARIEARHAAVWRAWLLGELGRREEALEAITEAVQIRRQLAAARPDAYLPDLATSLNNLSVDLGDMGRRQDALEAITEAVEIRRQLAARWPDAHLDELEQSLQVLAWLDGASNQ